MDETAYIIKSSSTAAKTYFDSPIFRKSLELDLCQSIRFVQNSTRQNEKVVRYGKDQEIIPDTQAGVNLLKEIYKIMQHL